MKNKLLLCLVLAFTFSISYAQKSYIYQTQDGAIRGYDPVSYFTENQPIKGLSEYSLEWKNVRWYFSSKENMEVFRTNPEKYAPQYGGYCAYSVAKGYTAKIDPLVWEIVDEKLYLNYNISVQKNWKKYQEKYISQAEKNWPTILGSN
jgi:YHS domain-containing protein